MVYSKYIKQLNDTLVHNYVFKRSNRLEMKRSKLNLDLKSLYNQKSQTTTFKDSCSSVQNQTVPGISSVFNQEVVNDNVSLKIPSLDQIYGFFYL